jgi:hypothetical protein
MLSRSFMQNAEVLMFQYKVDFDSIHWESPMPGLRCKIAAQGDKRLRFVEYSGELEPHWCENGHIGYILEGEFEIEFESEILTYRPGDGVFILPGPEHRHKGRVLTDTVKVIFVEENRE